MVIDPSAILAIIYAEPEELILTKAKIAYFLLLGMLKHP